MAGRWDDQGRAYKGSMLQVQIYVNRRPSTLSKTVLDAFPDLAARTQTLVWVSPLAHQAYQEPRDEEVFRRLGAVGLFSQWLGFWPRRGPTWDALGLAIFPSGPPGLLLVEGKSYPAEMIDQGSHATGSSLTQILRAVAETQSYVGVPADPESWVIANPAATSPGCLYQSANRLATLYWMREKANREAWLVNLCFTDDPTWAKDGRSTSEAAWIQELAAMKTRLGLPEAIPYCSDVFLPGLPRSALTAD